MGEGQEILSNKKKGLCSLSLFSSCSGPAVLGLISALDVKPERCWASPEQFLRICWVFFCFFFGVVQGRGKKKDTTRDITPL